MYGNPTFQQAVLQMLINHMYDIKNVKSFEKEVLQISLEKLMIN